MTFGGAGSNCQVVVENPTTGRKLSARVHRQGPDLVVSVGGGAAPHVGCVVMAVPVQPKPGRSSWAASTSVLTIPSHKEEPIARGIAERLAVELMSVVVVTAGVHDDNLDRAGIEDYLDLGVKLGEELEVQLRSEIE